MISEGLQCRSFQEEFSQEQCFQQESFQSFKEVSFRMSACEQDVMCSDTRACALGQEHVLSMSACAVGTVKSVGKGTVCEEMLSQLKEVASSLLERQGVVFPGSAKLPGSLQRKNLKEPEAMESASSGAKKKDLEQMRSALEENTSVVKELLAAHSRTTTLVQELNSEVKDTKWQLQEMQEADERGRASIHEKLKEFHRNVEDLQEQFKEAMDDFCEHVNETGEKATEEEEEEDKRARKEEAELRREGHLRGTISRTTSPTSSRRRTGERTTEEQEPEYSDKGLFEKLMEEEEDYEAYLENENEYYTQSYTGPTKEDYPWEEEEEGEGKKESKGSGEARAGLTEEEKRKLEEAAEKEEEERKKTRGPRNEQRRRKRRWKDLSTRTTTHRSGRSTQKTVRSTGNTA